MSISLHTARKLQQVTDNAGVVALLEIEHPVFDSIYLVNDTRSFESQGKTYLALPFAVTLPNDAAKEAPRAQLQMDNVGRDITADLESLPPGASLSARLMIVHRTTPDVIDYEFNAALSGVKVDVTTVTASMGQTDLLRRSAVLVRFDPANAPGVFAA